ncbi:3-hydroxyacyl-CoA dehydrogenase NAD-binding domain-containing protein [Pseudomonas plecoglossicida]|uniref:3-hydroxyacyl-CoA dehydrogenase NAD-binding domain-containing protein n=1 Tax=Pseudomonas plecoglossicida TaxID=70775 RepID=UPI00051CC9FF|nr:3-hydroxyacyl-CoA dehydrogenase NAD-binding domain-containing protein [Pseudomonas plecoglossicida]KGK25400.1 hypothetical protein GT93_11300 [Pseudomonas plecoglossicida]
MYSGETMVLIDLGEGFTEWRLDARGAVMNSLGAVALTEWAQVLDILESTSGISGVLLSSAKSSFIAGANIKEFPSLFANSIESIFAWARHIQELCNRMESLPFPTVAAIEGVALGGGFEMALSVDRRIVSHSAQLGLPEVTLGICPGWGGSVRLPRLMGLTASLPWILEGKPRHAREALDAGVADLVTQSHTLRATALSSLKVLSSQGPGSWEAIRARKRGPVNHLEVIPDPFPGLVGAPGNIPGSTILKTVQASCHLPFDDALALEAECFAMLAKGSDAAALIGLFIADQRLKKSINARAANALPTQSCAVVGSGLMGVGIAYQLALNNVWVKLRDTRQSALDSGLDTVKSWLEKAVDKGQMTVDASSKLFARIATTRAFDGFDQTDIVIEAVAENFELKRSVLAEAERYTSPSAVITTNTSTLSITALAQGMQRPDRFCGLHFFNPVTSMQLVEVVRGAQSSPETVARAVKFALALGKKPIVVSDSPGFLINRILFPYFNAFNRLLLDGVPFERVDQVMEAFGWPMGPALLADVIGLDTMVNADKTLQEAYPERMAQPSTVFVEHLLADGYVGKKGGSGFYEYGPGSKKPTLVALALTRSATPHKNVSDTEIVERLMLPFCAEALRCLDEGVVESADDVDLGAVLGLGFPRFRGGPLRYIESMGMQMFLSAIERHASISQLYVVPEGLSQRIRDSQPLL